MGIYRYATSIDKYCYDILNSIILQCTNDWGRYSSYESVEAISFQWKEKSFQWNDVFLPVEQKKANVEKPQ